MTKTDDLIAERGKTHGDWERQANTSAKIKAALYIEDFVNTMPAPLSEALDHIAIKMARIVSGDPWEPDHWRDIQGYARLAELWIKSKKVES